ncbi:hypothetical protein DV451_004640 [Geotrichum candidum]|uniref:J domain-containing protein n=1 Tax=Geotrichum candidum TaxID=1173061 RepID=A0A0J9XFZ6_GEOCN|nr:hypothetical protein DV451_004640 [Geotrichum candidum]KAI9214512.1 hypothetical protein DS838_000591 [Geotrichum bryndzae]KAF5110142.1 hypothetical protein DV453_001124 [Geotrichum candidum]KAF5115769.1 hypothetical protein DV454_002109 [Geotrichum candidum]KAF5119488.1 hypothetical protein DV452_001644 [Geotrichum candidum]
MTEESDHELPENISSVSTRNAYVILGLVAEQGPQYTAKEVTKAYRRRALQVHPDKAPSAAERPDFHVQFQELALAYSVLGDVARRARYDAAGGGSLQEALSDETGDMEQGAAEFFRELWKTEVTQEMIDRDREGYRFRDEERVDVVRFYVEGTGDLDHVMSNVLHSEDADEDRFVEIIKQAIKAGEAKEFKLFKDQLRDRKGRKARRAKAAQQEAKEAEELRKELGLDEKLQKKRGKRGGASSADDEEASLRALIQSRGQKRMSSLIDGLEAKYGASSKRAKKQKTSATAASADSMLEPTEDEFLKIQAEIEERRNSNKRTAKSKPKGKRK